MLLEAQYFLLGKNEPEDEVSSKDLCKGIYFATDRGVISPWYLRENRIGKIHRKLIGGKVGFNIY